MPSVKNFTIPKTLAAAADLMYETKQARLLLDRQVEELRVNEALLKAHLISKLQGETTGVSGRFIRVTAVVKLVPEVKDWEAFYKFIKKNNAFELLQKRVSGTAVNERWDVGKTVDGVIATQFVDLSINKL